MNYILTQQELDNLNASGQIARREAQQELIRVKQDLADALVEVLPLEGKFEVLKKVREVFAKHDISIKKEPTLYSVRISNLS